MAPKILTIVPFCLLGIFNMGYTQTDNTLIKGSNILKANGIMSHCFTFTSTPKGEFIGTRLDDNTPINYVFRAGKLTTYEPLNSYVIFGFCKKHNALIVGFYDKRLKFADTMAREFYIFKIDTEEFIQQVKYDADVYEVSLSHDGDSLITFPNIKNPGGIGSNPQRRTMKIKLN